MIWSIKNKKKHFSFFCWNLVYFLHSPRPVPLNRDLHPLPCFFHLCTFFMTSESGLSFLYSLPSFLSCYCLSPRLDISQPEWVTLSICFQNEFTPILSNKSFPFVLYSWATRETRPVSQPGHFSYWSQVRFLFFCLPAHVIWFHEQQLCLEKRKMGRRLITAIHRFPGLSKCLFKDYRNKCPKIYSQDQLLVLFFCCYLISACRALCKPLKLAIL